MCARSHKSGLDNYAALRKTTTLQNSWRVVESGARYRLGLNCLGDHSLKEDFDCHRVSATVMRHKEFAIANKGPIVEGNMVIIVVTMKCQIEFVEKETVSFLSIAFCLLSLADQSIVHCCFSFQDRK
jgi:hypothetical protein